MENFLLIDIGGTNLRYAIADNKSKLISNIKKEKIKNSETLDSLIDQILKITPVKLNNIVLCVAGPKLYDSIEMTNRNLKINLEDIKAKYKLSKCYILNDWEAVAYSCLNVKEENLFNVINKNKQPYNNIILCVGPGTGLGVSLLVNHKFAHATEIGNINFGIKDLVGNDFYFSGKFRKIEEVLSGPAISKYYKYLTKKNISPEEVIRLAGEKDVDALEVVNDFLKKLAYFLAQLSLIYLPGKGIYLSGSLIRSLKIFLENTDFKKNYLSSNKNSPQYKILENTAINIVDKEHLALYGCLNYINLVQKA